MEVESEISTLKEIFAMDALTVSETHNPSSDRVAGVLVLLDKKGKESLEEVGLPESFVRVVATLKPVRNRSGIVLYPTVGVLMRPFEPSTSSEVDRCFWAELNVFLTHENHSCMYFSGLQVHSFTVNDTNVFGITSFICILVAATVYNRFPEYPAVVFRSKEKTPREAVADVLARGLHGTMHQNKL
ncbi:hypothetical protein QR680_009613 [Steinernema hermaphroditum]|uniref:Uncharacterized protein n=1 Tax=Steinernema hermaphroditum TaxID=289476 RepID=A0AA39IME0_9BILA|nr:hypothetical protein QR680_009613 [Steinernema hermaphroditum]